MYAQPAYTVRFAHKLYFKGKGQSSNRYMGDLKSYNDSTSYRVSSELVVYEAKVADFPVVESGNYNSFVLSAPDESSSEVHKYLKFLKENPHRAGLIYLDSAGSMGLLIPLKDSERFLIGYNDGFRCCIVKNKQREKKSHDPSRQLSVTAGGGATGNSIQNRGDEQKAAASHYNELVRDKSTRHKSHIYHLRNLNNFIKMEIINGAANKSKLEYLNHTQRMLPGGGISVIDFGCGMGGDVFKWFKNSAGLRRYVGVDIADNSLAQFRERLLGNPSQGIPRNNDYYKVTHLICADMGVDSLTSSLLPCHTWKDNTPESIFDQRVPLVDKPITAVAEQPQVSSVSISTSTSSVPQPQPDIFDVASCQFAIHYMFQSPAKAHHFFEEVARHLRPGGVFIATTMDCRVIAEELLKSMQGPFDPLADADLANIANETMRSTINDNTNETMRSTINDNTNETGDTADAIKVKDPFQRIKDVYAAHQRQKEEQEQQGRYVLQFRNDVGSTILRIKFEEKQWKRLLRLGGLPAAAAAGRDSDTGSNGVNKSDATATSRPHDGGAMAEGSGAAAADMEGGGVGGVGDGFKEQELEQEQSPCVELDANAFGIQYTFTLHDTDTDAAVDAPEWIVPLGSELEKLASAHGLRVAEVRNFQDMTADMFGNMGKIRRMEQMHCFNCKGTISAAEWNIARLYTKIIFVKDRIQEGKAVTTNGPFLEPSSPDGPPPPLSGTGDGPFLLEPSSPDGPPPPLSGKKRSYESDSDDGNANNGTKSNQNKNDGTKKARFVNSAYESSDDEVGGFASSSAIATATTTTGSAAEETADPYGSSDDEDDDLDEATMMLLKVRERAMELAEQAAGGASAAWDALDDQQVDYYMELARKQLELQ